MKTVTIKSSLFYRGFGTFFIGSPKNAQVYLETETRKGARGAPLCRGGQFIGAPLIASESSLESVAERWVVTRMGMLKEKE
jgi:hypothetical protein